MRKLEWKKIEPDNHPLTAEEIAAYEEAKQAFARELAEAEASGDEQRIAQVLEDWK